MSAFNVEDFMNETTDAALDTVIIPIPVGEYNAQVEKVEPRAVTFQNKKTGADEERALLDVTYEIFSDEAKTITGREKLTIRQSIFLDIDEATGKLDYSKGKNIGLGKLREACDLNAAGKSFSIPQLIGQMVKVKVGMRADKNDASVQYNEVKSVGKAA